MKTLEPMTTAETKRIARLVRTPTPMTMKRLLTLAWDSDSLTTEETVAGTIHAFQIAMAALEVVEPENQPTYDYDEEGELTCIMCGASRRHDPIHTDDCPWDVLAKTVAGEAIHLRR